MWVSDKVVGLFQIAKDSVDALREELVVARAEASLLKQELAGLRVTNEWMRHKINGLEVEKAALVAKIYNVEVPVPEILRQNPPKDNVTLTQFGFDHIDDETARRLGIENLLS